MCTPYRLCFQLYRDPEGGELLDVQIQRAPKNFNARARIFYFIYHPEKVTSMNMFDTKLSPVEIDQNCPKLKSFPQEYWHRNFSISFTEFIPEIYRKYTGSKPKVISKLTESVPEVYGK